MGNHYVSICLLVFSAGVIWSPLVIDGLSKAESTLSAVSDFATTLGVGFAIYVGLSGLKTWRKQMAYGQNHELAKRTLIAVNDFISCFDDVRNPLVIPEPVETKEELGPLQIHDLGVIKVYEYRWTRLEEAYQILASCAVEARILWGGDLQGLQELRELKTKLFTATQHYVTARHPKCSPRLRESLQDYIEKERNILYAFGEDDPFRNELLQVANRMQSYLERYLVRIPPTV